MKATEAIFLAGASVVHRVFAHKSGQVPFLLHEKWHAISVRSADHRHGADVPDNDTGVGCHNWYCADHPFHAHCQVLHYHIVEQADPGMMSFFNMCYPEE